VSIASGFFAWWISELSGLLPAARSPARAASRLTIVALEPHGEARVIGSSGRSADPVALSEAIAGLDPRSDSRVCLRVRPADCLIRDIELPSAATRDFGRMLRLDLERSTPLKGRDVLSAHMIVGPAAGAGLVRVRHLVVKRRTVEPALTALRAAGIEIAAVDCWNEDGSAALPVRFLDDAEPTAKSGSGRLAWWAACATAVLLAAAWLAQVSRQQHALAALDAGIGRLQSGVREVRRQTEEARAAVAFAEQLRRLKEDRLPATMILEEVTRLLPDSVWLQEFRLDNDIVELAGLAASASALLPLLERSQHFHETSFTAPVRLEQGEDRERFRIRTRLKSAPAVAAGKDAWR
jgi:general secretion pathway protein L